MDYRHEIKHEINLCDLLILRQRLSAVAKPDPHSVNGAYQIRSLYFDDIYDSALNEKLDGVNMREKFRIRYYNSDTSYMVLEKKSKINGLCRKEEERITVDEAEKIISGRTSELITDSRPLLTELHSKMKSKGLRPKTIVDYTRLPFVYPAGNVRVTIDFDIRTGLRSTDFLDAECVTVPVTRQIAVLEIKWDEFLPDIIRDAVNIDGRFPCAFSKYANCRIYD